MKLKDYWPISLVAYIYKLLVKVLANQIREVMPCIIGKAPDTFTKGRQIHDGDLIENEEIHLKDKSKKKELLFKIVIIYIKKI